MKIFKTLFCLGFSFVLFNCSGGGESGVTTNIKSLSSGKRTNTLSENPFTNAVAGDYGAASVGSSGLSSFKLYIKSIEFCESIEVTAGSSAYNNPENCATVYENDEDDNLTVSQAASAGEGKYFDLLSADDRAALSQKVDLEPGTYNAGIITWHTPVKITATIPLGNGDSLHTKECTMDGMICEATDIDLGEAEEAIVDFNNGGTWMKFLKPLVITGDEAVVVDLAFDLEQRVFGGADVSNGQIQQATGCDASTSGFCGIYMPIVRLMPVAHGVDEDTVVETYEMEGPSEEWKIRVDVYYNSGDPDKAILAADIFPIPTDETAESIAAGVYVYSVSESGGVTRFLDVDGNDQLSDFERDDDGTATLTCPSGATLVDCPEGEEVELTWSSRTIRTL